MRMRALIALVLLLCACRQQQETPAPDAVLKDTLSQMRRAIDRFYRDNKRYPSTLDELVPNYVRQIPVDPVTRSAKTWQLVREEAVQPNADFTTSTSVAAAPQASGIIDVRSGAGGAYSSY